MTPDLPNPTELAIPAFVLLMLVEIWWVRRRDARAYEPRDTLTSLALGLGSTVAGALTDLNARFADILDGPAEQTAGPLKAENEELPDLPRLILPFNRVSFARLRQLIDFVNRG